jgi:hypothetical protein
VSESAFFRGAVPLAVSVMLVLSCEKQPTGVVVTIDMAGVQADELRFTVTAVADDQAPSGTVVVDPSTSGRVRGPFDRERQRQPIYLDEGFAGKELSCLVTAWMAGSIVGSASGNVRLEAGEMTEMRLVLTPAPGQGLGRGPTGRDGGAPTPDGGGGAVTPDAARDVTPGLGDAAVDAVSVPDGGPDRPGPGPVPPVPPDRPPLQATGSPCRLPAECASGTCAQGVCCSAACSGPCRACNLPGLVGVCSPVRAGVVCQAAGCQNKNFVVPSRICDGAGQCAGSPMIKCPNQTTCTNGACS